VFNDYLLLLMLGHILGDFYAQTTAMAENKKHSLRWVMVHSLAYFAAMSAACVPVMSAGILGLAVMAGLLHGAIDTCKYLLLKGRPGRDGLVFVVDQCAHIISLLALTYIWSCGQIPLRMWIPVSGFFAAAGISKRLVCRWVLGLLLIHKPANIMIQIVMKDYKPASNTTAGRADNRAGRMIGSLERFIMLLLMSCGQYAAIGLVLTAKSIARYDRISKDEQFAEYYLLGTLMSTAVVISCALLLF